MQSVRRFHPDVQRFIVLADAYRDLSDVDTAAELVFCDDIGIQLISNMKLWYSVIELNTAIKPFVFCHLFDRFGFEKVVYLDPDILLFGPLTEVFDGLEEHNIVLIPHIMQPLHDGKEPSDHSIMKSGVYNLGFLGVRSDRDARALIDWWSARCYLHCRVDVPANMFTDQRWMDLAPVFVPDPLILRHPGYDVAYWNLSHRDMRRRKDGTWLVNGQPLVFFHFSGIDPEDPSVFSRHQNRFTMDTLGPAAELCELYRRQVLANGWIKYARLRYGFAAFPDGRPIEYAMRHWLFHAVDSGDLDPQSPIAVGSDFFDQPDEEAARKGVTITRFMHQFWRDRQDLQAEFDIFTAQGCARYFEWFLSGEAHRQGVDLRSIAAARRIGPTSEPERSPALPDSAIPPWPSVSRLAWDGPSRDAARFLERDVVALIAGEKALVPIQIALLWELRPDLQANFHLRTIDSLYGYLAWTLTSGVIEGMVNCSELSPQFLHEMTRESATSAHYGDVPITTWLVALRSVEVANRHYEYRRRFPVERLGRLAHGIWCTYVGARQFNWPQELVAPQLKYFETPSAVQIRGYRLTNAMVGIWELQEDIQQDFPLDTEASIYGYLLWLLTYGLRDMDISFDHLGKELREFLLLGAPGLPGLESHLRTIYRTRGDLHDRFDISTEEGWTGFRAWWLSEATGLADDQAMSALFGQAGDVEKEPEAPVYTTKIALTGQWSAPTGRGEDVRCSAACLQEVGFFEFLIIDSDTHQILNPDGSALPTPCKVDVELNIVHLNACTAYADWRLLQRLGVSARTNVGFWAWELERLPGYWRHAFSFFDEIWASTHFAERAYSHERLRPVRLMPMAVITPVVPREISRRELNLPPNTTVFLFVFDFRSFAERKNPEAVVRAFLQAFPSGDEQVFLMIKTMGADQDPSSFDRLAALSDDQRILLRDISLDRDELLGLVRACDAYVSLHRSEGFGRGPAEAMLLGRPTILTAYSGTNDFATGKCAYLVDYRLVQVDLGQYLGVERQRWADANVASAAHYMRIIHERPDEARRIGERGRARIMRLLDPSVIGPRLLSAVTELSALTPV